MLDFTYMGTKKALAATINALSNDLKPGPFLDLFSGISAAGSSIAPRRQVWCNDAQVFSRTLTEALYLSAEEGPRVEHVRSAILTLGNANLNELAHSAQKDIDEELTILWGDDPVSQIALQTTQIERTRESRSRWRTEHSHCLFTAFYAGSYLGLTQCMQVDSIRYGADIALSRGVITWEEHRWAIIAICRAVAAASNSTGHFAQYLTASATNIHRVTSKRRRCIWSFWSAALAECKPLGDLAWRRHNRVFHGDAVDVLSHLNSLETQPSIIYADPPYTNDQYSRYYHLLETVLLYDYPSIEGKGLYRGNRFRSSFSLSTKVNESFEGMVANAALTGADLMISYPSNGLLPHSLQQIPKMLASYFAKVKDPIVIPHKHSTLGGSKGSQKEDVEECIFIGQHALS